MLYYIYKDHLGSYQAVTDIAGNKIDSLSFNPWGNRRNPADWSYPTPQTGFLFDRGFTGHEHLGQFNLINMNGRVYDPLLGRFLSPDNYVQLPDYTQSLNRYSYALNNPLIYIDPTGEKVNWPKFTWFNAIPIIGQFDYLFDFINANTRKLSQKMVEANVPSFGAGYNSTYGTGFYVGNNPMVYPAYENKIAIGQQSISAQVAGFSGMGWEPAGFRDIVINQQFVGESPLANGVANTNEKNNSLYLVGSALNALSFTSGIGEYSNV